MSLQTRFKFPISQMPVLLICNRYRLDPEVLHLLHYYCSGPGARPSVLVFNKIDRLRRRDFLLEVVRRLTQGSVSGGAEPQPVLRDPLAPDRRDRDLDRPGPGLERERERGRPGRDACTEESQTARTRPAASAAPPTSEQPSSRPGFSARAQDAHSGQRQESANSLDYLASNTNQPIEAALPPEIEKILHVIQYSIL